MALAHEKGNALELAVRAIELAILRTSPNYNEKTFLIESKKIIKVGGVHHEIDIWVRVALATGYDAIFIFECKNWQKKISKNEIIVFAEKIQAAQAQTGFLVAQSFTSDAVAQAAKEPRIQLLHASELPLTDVPIPLGFHGIQQEHINVSVDLKSENSAEGAVGVAIDLSSATCTIDGQAFELNNYIGAWINEDACARINAFRSEAVPQGLHPLPFSATRDFRDRLLIVNGQRILRISLAGEVSVRVFRARVVSQFDVQNRGRAVSVLIETPNASINAAFAYPANQQ